MNLCYFITITGEFNSKELYEILLKFGDVNLIDMGDKSIIFGEAPAFQTSQIVYHCSLFGSIEAELHHKGGAMSEQEAKNTV